MTVTKEGTTEGETMKDATQDLLDLCRLNLMEEHIQGSPAVDRDATLAAIDFKRRQVATALTANPPTLAPDAMERHRRDNTADDGTYPWTDSPKFRAIDGTKDRSEEGGAK